MLDNRNSVQDLAALAVLVTTLFLAASLVSYDPADRRAELPGILETWFPVDSLVYPPNSRPQNACGPTGVLVADLLLRLLGIGAYYTVGSLGVVAVCLLLQKPIDRPPVRLAGWILSLAGLCGLSDIFLDGLSPGPVVGPAGLVGAAVGRMLVHGFGPLGGVLLGVTILAVGLFLCTDYVLIRLAASTAMTLARRALNMAVPVRRRSANRNPSPADGAAGVSIRIGGKQVVAAAEAEESEAEEQDYEWDEEEEEYEDAEAADEEGEWDEEQEEEEGDEAEQESDVPAVGTKADSGAGGGSGTGPAKGLRKLLGPTFKVPKRPSAPPPDQREEVMQQLEEASRQEKAHSYELPPIDLLCEPDTFSYEAQEKEVRRKAKILEKTFRDFGFNVRVVEIETGPVIAQYEVELEAGLRLSKITGLADDLAIALRVPSVRIVAPIPGKNTVGIEVPNQQRQIVRLREVMQESNGRVKKMRIPLFLGKDVSGNPLIVDLSTMPHLLIAGRTGTGKSVCLNAIISSILMTRTPDEVRMLMIDPKMVELSGYRTLPHLMHPVVTDMRKAEAILAWAVEKMEERYSLLAEAGVRHLASYNQLSEEELMERLRPETDEQREAIPRHLPYIVIVADEMADLMMTAGKEVEQHIIRLAQKSRAVGIHLILATQKPTVDVITGLIKSNLPARLCFQVASRTDSRVVLDEMGAEKLLGNGDMLFLWPGTSTLLRGQGTYLSDEEINAIVDAVSTGEQDFVHELVQMKVEPAVEGGGPSKKQDELYETAVEIVIREGRGSVSLLQRALGIGYGRAARLIDYMAEDGLVGPYNGSQAREVTISLEDWQRMREQSGAEPDHTENPPRRTNKVVPDPPESPSAKASSSSPARPRPALAKTTSARTANAAARTNDAGQAAREVESDEFDSDEYATDDYDGDEYEQDDYDHQPSRRSTSIRRAGVKSSDDEASDDEPSSDESYEADDYESEDYEYEDEYDEAEQDEGEEEEYEEYESEDEEEGEDEDEGDYDEDEYEDYEEGDEEEEEDEDEYEYDEEEYDEEEEEEDRGRRWRYGAESA